MFRESLAAMDPHDLNGRSSGEAGIAECLLSRDQPVTANAHALRALEAAIERGDRRAEAERLLLVAKTETGAAARTLLLRSAELFVATDGRRHSDFREVERRLRDLGWGDVPLGPMA